MQLSPCVGKNMSSRCALSGGSSAQHRLPPRDGSPSYHGASAAAGQRASRRAWGRGGRAGGAGRTLGGDERLHAPPAEGGVREDVEGGGQVVEEREGAGEHRDDQRGDAARQLARGGELQRDELPHPLARPLNEEEDEVEGLVRWSGVGWRAWWWWVVGGGWWGSEDCGRCSSPREVWRGWGLGGGAWKGAYGESSA